MNDTCDFSNKNDKDNFSFLNTDEYNQLEAINSKDIVHSTPKDIVDYSIIKNSENNFSIVLDVEKKVIEPIIKVNQNSENDKNLLNKRGMYVTPCLNVKVIHQKPAQKKFKKNFIKNGNRLLPCMINNNKLYLFNTCPFDSITEIVSAACCNSKNSENFITSQIRKETICFFTCVRNYTEHGATASFYKLRAKLLYSLYPSANNNITCEDNVCDLFSKLMSTYDTNIEIIRCQNSQCCAVVSQKISILNLSAKIIWEKGIRYLNESVDELIHAKISYCQSCHKTPPVKLSKFVIIYV